MRVYLDNNVLVDIEQGKIREEVFCYGQTRSTGEGERMVDIHCIDDENGLP